MENNHYNILEVPSTATVEEIKKSYRRLSLLYHPDRNKGNSEATLKFQKINEAYEVLGDPDKRKEYDMINNNPFLKMMGQMPQGMSPMDSIFSNIFGHGGIGVNFNNSYDNGPANIKIFHNGIPINIFQQKPTPIIQSITIPLDKIYTGTTLPVDIERWIMQENTKIFEKETIYLDIPKGVDEGEILLLQGKGNIMANDIKGDVKIFIKIENHGEFKRSGLDLIYEKTISLKESLCGFTFEIKYLTGKIYTIANTNHIVTPGYQKMIPNMGLSRDSHTGNLIINFNVKFPEKIEEKTLEQLKQMNF
jgi:DnaJ-class molecular chaperone